MLELLGATGQKGKKDV